MRRSLCLLLLIPSFALGQNVASIARGNQSFPGDHRLRLRCKSFT